MHKFPNKKAGISTRGFKAWTNEIDSHLPSFPPINDGTDALEKLPEDEILDLLECGVPNLWQKTTILQDFDPLSHLLRGFVSFCEHSE